MLAGQKHTTESIERMRTVKSGKNNPNFGVQRSRETREKTRATLLGHRVSDETKKKISNSLKGCNNPCYKNRTKEHNKKIGMSQVGRYIDPISITKSVESKIGGFWYGNVKYYNRKQYCEKWNSNLRERVRAFFNYKCVECGIDQSKQKLHVHHVHYNKKLCCDDTPRSLVPLCQSCHAKTNFNREYWSSHFQEILDTIYGGKCWIARDEFKEKFYGNISLTA